MLSDRLSVSQTQNSLATRENKSTSLQGHSNHETTNWMLRCRCYLTWRVSNQVIINLSVAVVVIRQINVLH